MREADLMFSRRRFLVTSLKASAGVAAGLVIGPEVFDMLDRMGPRRLMMPGVAKPIMTITDADLNRHLQNLFVELRATMFNQRSALWECSPYIKPYTGAPLVWPVH